MLTSAFWTTTEFGCFWMCRPNQNGCLQLLTTTMRNALAYIQLNFFYVMLFLKCIDLIHVKCMPDAFISHSKHFD